MAKVMAQTITPIVEGQGDVRAAPDLIRRVLYECLGEHQFQVASPKRLKRIKIESDLSAVLQYAARETRSDAIIVMIDSDEECAHELAEKISRITKDRNIGIPVATVCPKTEYETWFIASIDSIRGQSVGGRGIFIDASATCPANVEEISGAKEWLTRRMPVRMAYKPTQDQKPLTSMIDLQLASKRSRSFQRLCHAVEEVVDGIRSRSTKVTP